VDEKIDAYLQTYQARLKPSTWRDYKSILGAHLGAFASFEDLNSGLESYLAGLKVSGKRRNNILTAARSFLRWGLRRRLWAGQLYEVPRFKARSVKVKPLTPREAGLVMDYARPPYNSFFQLSILTGLRTGEALGLRFEDFDLERGLLFIRRARTGSELVDPKSAAGVRELPIFRPIRELYQRRKAGNFRGSPWFMYSERGEVFARSTLRRIWKGLLRAFDIPDKPMYATRHTFASLAIAAGEDPLWIARMMGHSRADQLLLRYATFLEGVKDDGHKLTELICGKASLMRALPGKSELP
jgi:integrase